MEKGCENMDKFTYELNDYVEKLNEVIPCLLTETGNPEVLEK